MLEERGCAAGCLKCSRVRERWPAAGTRHSEERRARFEGLLRAMGDANMARADERVNEHLARQVQNRVEAGAAVAPHPIAPARIALAQGEQGELVGRAEPAFAGVSPAVGEAEGPHAPSVAMSDDRET
eukprot:4727521-Alexandrium_andersonii.AAC.1